MDVAVISRAIEPTELRELWHVTSVGSNYQKAEHTPRTHQIRMVCPVSKRSRDASGTILFSADVRKTMRQHALKTHSKHTKTVCAGRACDSQAC